LIQLLTIVGKYRGSVVKNTALSVSLTLITLVQLGVNKPIATQHPEPVEGCGFAQGAPPDPHPFG